MKYNKYIYIYIYTKQIIYSTDPTVYNIIIYVVSYFNTYHKSLIKKIKNKKKRKRLGWCVSVYEELPRWIIYIYIFIFIVCAHAISTLDELETLD